ncbi:MAG: hypothetical protein H0U98_03905 [Alphaproteobacteria bacterium]|nr:hypothetical protein [Alphaproteobacteria bacterium]
MKMKLIIVVLALGLGGCAQGARVDQMAAMPTTALPATSELQHAIQLNSVTGGTTTNPLWMSKVGNPEFQAALASSLGSAGLLANGEGRYRLDAKLEALRQPMMGFDLTVHTQVHYTLTDTKLSKPVFDHQIDSDFTATVGDAFMAVERLRLANEGSIKQNIRTFMDQMIAEFGSAPKVSVTGLRPPGG